jgi:hypothetical protein
MSKQLHKRFTTDEIVTILERYLSKEIDVEIALRLLKIGRCQFFKVLKNYRENPDTFTIAYERKKATRRIDETAERLLHQELEKEKRLIENKDTPVKTYNYSYIQQRLLEKQGIQLSLPTIIDRAKKMIFTNKSPRRNVMIAKS